jgi:hypothetical protein
VTLAVDLHAHTRFFHGFDRLARVYDPIGARMLTALARRRGLDAVATTNHDYYRDLEGSEGGASLLPGIEVTTSHGHVLVVGPSPPRRTEAGELTPEQLVDVAHDRGCAAIVAHPFRNSTVRETDADFDAVEVNGKGTESIERVRRFAEARDLPLVGGSDAHLPVEVGRAYTEVSDAEPTAEGVVEAIRDGRVAARVSHSPSHRLFRSMYRFLHGQKGWLEDPRERPPGVGTPPGEVEHRGGSLPTDGDPAVQANTNGERTAKTGTNANSSRRSR